MYEYADLEKLWSNITDDTHPTQKRHDDNAKNHHSISHTLTQENQQIKKEIHSLLEENEMLKEQLYQKEQELIHIDQYLFQIEKFIERFE